MGFWPFNRKANEHAKDLILAVGAEQPRQAGVQDDHPTWAARLIRLLVSKWPSLLMLLLSIMEQATEKLSTEDKAEAMFGLRRYRRTVELSPKSVAKALEAAS